MSKSVFRRLKFQMSEETLVENLASIFDAKILRKALRLAESNADFTYNEMFTIDDLPLNEEQKKRVLEWYARKLWAILEEGIYQTSDYYGKSYDPLFIEGNVAHSYVFTWLSEPSGGGHHEFSSLADLEKRLTEGVIDVAKITCELEVE